MIKENGDHNFNKIQFQLSKLSILWHLGSGQPVEICYKTFLRDFETFSYLFPSQPSSFTP